MAPIHLVAYDPEQGGLSAEDSRDCLRARMPGVHIQSSGASLGDMAAAVERGDLVVVVMFAPEDSLAASLAALDDPAQGLEAWIAARRELLVLQRRNRRRLTLVDAALLTRGDDADWATLARRLGGEASGSGKPLDPAAQNPVPAPFYLGALALSLRNAEAVEVINALDAVTLGRARSDETRAVLSAMQAWRDSRDDAALLRENLAAQLGLHEEAAHEGVAQRKTVTALDERLREVLADHDCTRQALNRAEGMTETLRKRQSLLKENLGLQLETTQAAERQYLDEIVKLRGGYDAALKKAHGELAQTRQMAQAERTAREAQVRIFHARQARRDAVLGAQLLTEMETSARLRAALAEKNAEQMSLIEALSKELDEVYGSKSWRVTGPLRAAMTRLGYSRT